MPHYKTFDGSDHHYFQPPTLSEKITQESPKISPNTIELEEPTNPAIQTPRVEPQKQPEPATVTARKRIARASI